MDVTQTTKKRTFGASNGPAGYGTPESEILASDENPFCIPDAPPYRVIVPAGHTFGSLVNAKDFDTLAKLAEVILFCYKFEKTVNVYLMYDLVDKSYQMTAGLPMATQIDTNTLVALYRVKPMLITRKPWTEISQVPDSASGELIVQQNVGVCVASLLRTHVVISDTLIMQYETEAVQRSTDDFEPLRVNRTDLSASFVDAPATGKNNGASTGTRRADPIPSSNNNNNNVPPSSGDQQPPLPPQTPENMLRIPGLKQAYRIVVPPKMTFADVVDVPDLDMLRKVAQVVFFFYNTPRTIFVYVSYDANDRAYEVTFSCPRDAHVNLDFVTSIYSICPMLVTRKPWIGATRAPHPVTNEMQVTQNVTLRVASYRRAYLTLPDTGLLMWTNNCTYVPAEEEADIVRPAKRVPRLQWGQSDSMPAGPDAAGYGAPHHHQ